MGWGIAITSGVSMNDLPSVVTCGSLPAPARRWSSTAPHVLAAGDQITGRAPFTLGFGQSGASLLAADDTFATLTRTHFPFTSASSDSSKRFARSVSSSSFSGDDAIGTGMQSAAGAAPPAP